MDDKDCKDVIIELFNMEPYDDYLNHVPNEIKTDCVFTGSGNSVGKPESLFIDSCNNGEDNLVLPVLQADTPDVNHINLSPNEKFVTHSVADTNTSTLSGNDNISAQHESRNSLLIPLAVIQNSPLVSNEKPDQEPTMKIDSSDANEHILTFSSDSMKENVEDGFSEQTLPDNMHLNQDVNESNYVKLETTSKMVHYDTDVTHSTSSTSHQQQNIIHDNLETCQNSDSDVKEEVDLKYNSINAYMEEYNRERMNHYIDGYIFRRNSDTKHACIDIKVKIAPSYSTFGKGSTKVILQVIDQECIEQTWENIDTQMNLTLEDTFPTESHPLQKLKLFIKGLKDKFRQNLDEEVRQHIDEYLQGDYSENNTGADVDIEVRLVFRIFNIYLI